NESSKYGATANWQFQNTKLEWSATRDPKAPALLNAWGNTIAVTVSFKDCGMSGGNGRTQFKKDGILASLKANGLQLKLEGGYFEGMFRLGNHPANDPQRGNFIRFADLRFLTDIDDWDFIRSGIQGHTFPNMSFENVVMGGNGNPYNFTHALNSIPSLQAHRINVISMPTKNSDLVFPSDTKHPLVYRFFGQRTLIQSIQLFIGSGRQLGLSEKRIEIFSVIKRDDDGNVMDRLKVGQIVINPGDQSNGKNTLHQLYEAQLIPNTDTTVQPGTVHHLVPGVIVWDALEFDLHVPEVAGQQNRLGMRLIVNHISI
ncbi:MAG: hypothetical protein AAF466_14695, partial [Bacteroidota bacterium]